MRGRRVALACIVLGAVACRGTTPVPPEPTVAVDPDAAPAAIPPAKWAAIRTIVDAADRDADDRTADARRRPAEFLAFLDLPPGSRVADLGAGFGYTTELLARAVGPTGTVYGQNPEFVRKKFAEAAWTARLAKPVNANVVRLDREFVDPFPPDVRDLDVVVNVLFYHDFEWMGVDRAAHNLAVRNALRPGGRYVIVDAHAKAGAGASGSQSLHRIEESLVVAELEAAGFELVRRGDFLRNPADTRDWNALPWVNDRGEFSDKFVLEFRKRAGTPGAREARCTLTRSPVAAKVRDWGEAYALLAERFDRRPLDDAEARRVLCERGVCPTDRPLAVVVSDDPANPAVTSGGFALADATGVRVWSEQVGDVREYHCTPEIVSEVGRVGAFDHARLSLARHQVVGVAEDGSACEVDVDRGCMIGCFYDALVEVDLLRDEGTGGIVKLEATTALDRATTRPDPLRLVATDDGVRIEGCEGGALRVRG